MFKEHIWTISQNFKIDFYLEIFAIIIDFIILTGYLITHGKNKKIGKYNSSTFKYLLIANILMLASSALSIYFGNRPELVSLYKLTLISTFLFTYIQILLFHYNFYIITKTRINYHRIFAILTNIFIIITIILYIIVIFGGYSFRVDENGVFYRGNLYVLSKIIGPVILQSDAFIILFHRKKFSLHEIIGWLVSIIAPAISLIFGILYSPVYYHLTIMISLIIIYICLNVVEHENLIEKENIQIKSNLKIQKAQTDIMISQIQPHFLFNSLASISALCDIDPELAQEATNHFAKYLRMNLNSINQNKIISFKTELEHIKTYLWLEKIRFDTRLNVEYYIMTEDFNIPALSIQPIVENAIRHGLCQKTEGGTVSISTFETINEYRIIVKDDGIGFNMMYTPSGDQVHIGLKNCQERIRTLCNGTVDIQSSIGNGTIITVHIPK